MDKLEFDLGEEDLAHAADEEDSDNEASLSEIRHVVDSLLDEQVIVVANSTTPNAESNHASVFCRCFKFIARKFKRSLWREKPADARSFFVADFLGLFFVADDIGFARHFWLDVLDHYDSLVFFGTIVSGLHYGFIAVVGVTPLLVTAYWHCYDYDH
ncbi:hypothetical protein L7F22_015227 [Adiantum nelumboides]|nr:hypothetical protein [Adiantum nelumboides]